MATMVITGTNSVGTSDWVERNKHQISANPDASATETTDSLTWGFPVLHTERGLLLQLEAEDEPRPHAIERGPSYRGPRVGLTKLKEK